MRLHAHNITVHTPYAWEAQIYRREERDGSIAYPVVHAATFPLPPHRGDFGLGAVERMGPHDAFVVLFEFEREATGTPLFARQGRPVPRAADFHPRGLQRSLPGQSGAQWFFTENGRPFTLYIALGGHGRRAHIVPRVAELVAGVTIH